MADIFDTLDAKKGDVFDDLTAQKDIFDTIDVDPSLGQIGTGLLAEIVLGEGGKYAGATAGAAAGAAFGGIGAVPGAAIGKIAKARLTGGHMARTGSNYWDEMVKWKDKDVVNQIKNINSLNKAKILVEKAFNKWGIKPQNARGMKDSYERQLMDPVSEILRTSKYKQN